MYPLKTIIDFLLAGVNRIPSDERTDALLTMFTGMLPNMTEEEVVAAREQVIARFWSNPDIADEVTDLLDGHLTLRHIFAETDSTASLGSSVNDDEL